MKTITVNVSEPIYEEFQMHADKVGRKTSELIRAAMEEYWQAHIRRRTSLRDRRPTSVGGPIGASSTGDELLSAMFDGPRD